MQAFVVFFQAVRTLLDNFGNPGKKASQLAINTIRTTTTAFIIQLRNIDSRETPSTKQLWLVVSVLNHRIPEQGCILDAL